MPGKKTKKMTGGKINRWDIVCSKKKFRELKNDDRFWLMLTLGRIVNALYFCYQPAIDTGQKDTPSASRQRINSFLFASSILYEGLKVARTLGKHFNDLDSFKNGFAVLLKDKATHNLQKDLKQIRNKFVFHFDKDVAQKALENFDMDIYKFASGYGKASGEMYFGMADEVAIHYLLNGEKTDEELIIYYRQIVQNTSTLLKKYIDAAQELMGEVLLKMGWAVKEVK